MKHLATIDNIDNILESSKPKLNNINNTCDKREIKNLRGLINKRWKDL